MEDGRPSAFLSYSWDSDEHQSWVRELAERLVLNGVKVKLDIWDVAAGESLTAFMEDAVASVDFVVVVCTPNYAKRSQKRQGGVGYEQQLITARILAGGERSQFIPILREGEFSGDSDCGLPSHFGGMKALDLRESADSQTAFESLVRAIYNQPLHSPPELGNRPHFLDSNVASEQTTVAENMRLPTLELDGYTLESGVASNERAPETFHIPTAKERSAVSEGDHVKIQFELRADPSDSDVYGERMWVKVEGRAGPYFFGELDNQPLEQDENGYPLTLGDRIIFLPEHVISIVASDEDW